MVIPDSDPPISTSDWGNCESTGPIRVEVRWRGREGRVREQTFSLDADRWHTLLLGDPDGEARP